MQSYKSAYLVSGTIKFVIYPLFYFSKTDINSNIQ